MNAPIDFQYLIRVGRPRAWTGMMRTLQRLLVVFVSLTALVHCGPPRVIVTRLAPGEADLPGVRSIAISQVDGDKRDVQTFTGAVAEGLVKSNRYEVMERTQLEAVLKEKQVSEAPGSELAQVLPASALITGAITDVSYSEHMAQEATTCYNDKGKEYKCTAFTRVGTARFTANIRVVDSETGKVLLSKQLQREDVARTSADGKQPAPIDADVLKDSVTQQAADDFVAAIAPHEVSESVVLVEDGDLPQLKQGNAYVQRGDHAGSLEYYRAAVQKAETSGDMDPEIKGKAHYALGLALALGGDYESGLVELGKAYDLNPEDAWLDLQIRVKQWKADREKALEQVALNDEAPAEVAQQQTPSPDMAGAEEIPVDAERGTEAPADAEGMEGAEETSPEHSPANQ